MSGAWQEWLSTQADARAAANLERALIPTQQFTSEQVSRDGRSLVSFASNDYLNLRRDPRLIAAAHAAAQEYGVGSGASRLISGTTPLHAELEQSLADWYGSEAALVFTSGYHANVGVISALADKDALVVSDQLNHASIIDGARLSGADKAVYPHLDLDAARRACETSDKRTLLVSDAVFSIDGDFADIAGLNAVAAESESLLMFDDAHGIGALGSGGRGIAQGCELVTATLSKAFGALGGVVFCSAALREHLFNNARSFIFSTASDTPSLGAARAALQIIASEEGAERRARLVERSTQLREGLKERGLETGGAGHIVPLWLGENLAATALSARLADLGYFVPAVRPPTVPEGRSMLRFSVHSNISPEAVEGVLEALDESLG